MCERIVWHIPINQTVNHFMELDNYLNAYHFDNNFKQKVKDLNTNL